MAKSKQQAQEEIDQNLVTTFPTTQRGLILLLGVWELAWGFFIRNFGSAISQWLSREPGFLADGLGAIGLIIMLVGAMLLLSAAYPITYRWVTALATIMLLIIGLVVWIIAFGGLLTKPLIFHVAMNYLIPVIILAVISLNSYRLAKNMEKA